MRYSHIIWDFNGTIIDDTEAAIKSENVLLQRRNMPLIENRESYHRIFCFPITEYYINLGHNLEKESYNDIAEEWMEQYLNFSKESELHEGVVETLKYFKRKNIRQIVLSASESGMLIRQLTEFGIVDYFDEILGLDNIHAHSKVQIAKDWAMTEKPLKALLIGDTVHDFETAEALGADCVLIAGGHQSKKTLNECSVPVFDNLKELLKSEIIQKV